MSLVRGGEAASTLDLFGRRFVLLAGPGGGSWEVAARGAAFQLGLALDAHVVGGGELLDPSHAFTDAYGVGATGAVLVRPDGVVGWRARDRDLASESSVRAVLAALLHRLETS